MQSINYIKIAAANAAGIKGTFEDKIAAFDKGIPLEEVKKPRTFMSLVSAYEAASKGLPVDIPVSLDASASGIQMFAVASGCRISAELVNVVNTGACLDPYMSIAQSSGYSRASMKEAIMTSFYGSKAVPKRVFGLEYPQAMASIAKAFPGPTALKDYILADLWNSETLEHSFTMPDGFVVRLPVTAVDMVSLKAETRDNSKKWVSQSITVRKKQESGIELAAHIAHAMDAYVCRSVIAMCKDIEVLPIHDCFMAHPNHMNQVRYAYKEALCLIETENVMSRIINQLKGRDMDADCPELKYFHQGFSLVEDIRQSEYALN